MERELTDATKRRIICAILLTSILQVIFHYPIYLFGVRQFIRLALAHLYVFVPSLLQAE